METKEHKKRNYNTLEKNKEAKLRKIARVLLFPGSEVSLARDPKNNTMFRHGERVLSLLSDKGKVAGKALEHSVSGANLISVSGKSFFRCRFLWHLLCLIINCLKKEKMKRKMFFVVLAGLVMGFSTMAQEMPQAQKNLMQFVGKWVSSDIKLTIGENSYGGEYIFDCSAVNMNTGIIAHEHFTNDELGHMMGENLIGYDPNLQQIHLYSIDNMGTAHDHFGYWIDNKHLYVQYQGVVEGKMYDEQIDMVFVDDNTLKLNLTAMLNGEVFQKAVGTFKK